MYEEVYIVPVSADDSDIWVTFEPTEPWTPVDTVPPFALGSGDVYAIGPDSVYSEPRRVWLPVPAGCRADEAVLYFYHACGNDNGWYLADNIEGWLVPKSCLTMEETGAVYLGFLVDRVRHETKSSRGTPLPRRPCRSGGIFTARSMNTRPLWPPACRCHQPCGGLSRKFWKSEVIRAPSRIYTAPMAQSLPTVPPGHVRVTRCNLASTFRSNFHPHANRPSQDEKPISFQCNGRCNSLNDATLPVPMHFPPSVESRASGAWRRIPIPIQNSRLCPGRSA